MATVQLDIVDTSSINLVPGHVKIVRGVQVYGVTGSADIRTYNAYSALAALVPAITLGAAHPSVTGMYVSDITLKPMTGDPAQFEGTVTYENLNVSLLTPSTSNPAQISVGSTVQQQQTNKDQSGAKITVTYSGTDNGSVSTTYNADPLSVYKPQTVVTYERLEPSSPLSNATAYVGYVNSASFLGDAAKTWLCTRISGTSEDGGGSWKNRYEFQRAPSSAGWQQKVFYTSRATGAVPADVDVDGTLGTGNGVSTVDLYPSIDFAGLSL